MYLLSILVILLVSYPFLFLNTALGASMKVVKNRTAIYVTRSGKRYHLAQIIILRYA